MENPGVSCNVCECTHHCCDNKCRLTQIEVSNETTAVNAVATPHFCKSFSRK